MRVSAETASNLRLSKSQEKEDLNKNWVSTHDLFKEKPISYFFLPLRMIETQQTAKWILHKK